MGLWGTNYCLDIPSNSTAEGKASIRLNNTHGINRTLDTDLFTIHSVGLCDDIRAKQFEER